MANRLMEAHKNKAKALRKQKRKQREEKQLPFVELLKHEKIKELITVTNSVTKVKTEEEKLIGIICYGTDTLDPVEAYSVKVLAVKKTQKGHFITRIRCPYCNEGAAYDERWGAFICTKHPERKIIELFHNEASIPKIIEKPTER